MIQKSRFNAIMVLLAFFGAIGGAMINPEYTFTIPFLVALTWFFFVLASMLKLAFTGQPILYKTRVTKTEDGFTEHD